MANWWDQIIAGLDQATSEGKIGYTPQYTSYQPGFRDSVTATQTSARRQPVDYTSQMTAAADKQQRDLMALGGAGTLRTKVGNELNLQTTPQMPQSSGYMGMSDEELMAWLLGGSGGGSGGVDLSGYQGLIDDVNSRRDQMNIRKWQERKFLDELFGAGQQRLESDRDALEAAIQGSLESDQARRASEIGLIRGDEAARLATANEARAALGVEGGEDLSSEIAQNAAGSVGARGSVSERDARIREGIERQQIQSQIAGLIPMEQMAVGTLMSGYEDRLAALASERAGIKAQMAQARAAARGGSGPSVNEKLSALGFINSLNAPAEAPSFGGALGAAQEIQQYFGPEASNVLGIANRLLTGADLSRFDPTSMAGAQELLGRLATADPEVQMFLNRNPEAPGAIIKYIVESSK